MHIKTKEFGMTKKELFRAYIDQYVRLVWVFLVLAVLTLLYTKEYFFAILFILCLILLLFGGWFSVNSKKNKIFFKIRYHEIDEEFLYTYMTDGSMGKMKLDNIIRVARNPKYYRLYISKCQFVYLPFSIFYSAEDRRSFEALLKNKQLLK